MILVAFRCLWACIEMMLHLRQMVVMFACMGARVSSVLPFRFGRRSRRVRVRILLVSACRPRLMMLRVSLM